MKAKFKETEIGPIPEGWVFESLANQVDILMGQSPKSVHFNSSGQGTAFLQGVRTFGEKYPAYDTWTNEVTKLARAGSVLLSVRAPVGEVNLIDRDICIGRGLMAINGKNNVFIYYLLNAYKDYIVGKETGTVYGSVTKDDIAKVELPFPPVSEQKAIAEILSSLDDKIELNRQMNKTLESIAQTLFKQWFVDFEFPDKNGKPYKSNGGKMVKSELGEIPEGWSVGGIGEALTVKGGGTPSTTMEDYWCDATHNWITPKDLSSAKGVYVLDTEKKISFSGLQKISSGLLPVGTLLLSSRAPIGYLAINAIPLAINQGFIAMQFDKILTCYFTYFWVKSNLDLIKSKANGSTFLEINKANFRRISIVTPTESALKMFETVCEPIMQRIRATQIEIKNLSQTRDFLLPRLMSGKIRV